MENLHTVNSQMCVRSGVAREKQKPAHVIDVMRERFEDDCLLSTPSRADNQELE